jgi:hypothetical protein
LSIRQGCNTGLKISPYFRLDECLPMKINAIAY